MPESYTSGPNRVIIRHKGPAGKGIPTGGTAGQILAKTGSGDYATEWVAPPDGTDAVVFNGTVPADTEIVIFDGITGKLVKRSSITIGSIALLADLANKVDVVVDKGLSTNDFTNLLKAKLDSVPASGFFRGNFADLTAVNAFTFDPVPASGDYVTVAAPSFLRYWWNAATTAWVIETEEYAPDGEEIALLLFTDGAGWTLAGSQIFTPAYAALIDSHETIITNLGLGTSSTTSKGYASYFNLTGQVIPITTISDGTNNFVLVGPATAVSGNSNEFTGGAGSLGRLQYTGTLTPRVFSVHATVGHSGAVNDVVVFVIAKNGVIVSETRTISGNKSITEIQQINVSGLISLATNDYIEIFVANTTSTDGVTVRSLNISVTLA